MMIATTGLYADGEAIKNSNGGTIRNLNTGKITVKQKAIMNEGQIQNSGEVVFEQEAYIESDGSIDNAGQITSYGQIVRLNQNSIGGIVIIDSQNGFLTNVPTISYNNLQLKGNGNKIFDSNGNSVGVETYFSSDAGTPIIFETNQELQAFGEVQHNGRTNPSQTHGRFGLYGNASQNIHGTGFMQHLVLDNQAGADVINGGGFSVGRRLDLVSGELRNSADNNFNIGGDNAAIEINKTNGSIAVHPNNPENDPVNLNYLPNSGGQHITGGEVPFDYNLSSLSVVDTDGLQMNRDVEVDDSLYLAGNIRTYGADPSSEHTLTYNSADNPTFVGDYTEIDGKFRRTQLPAGFVNLFNNRYTSGRFSTEADKGNISSITTDIRPDTKYDSFREGDTKVFRTYNITATDIDGNIINSGFNMDLQYAWLHNPPLNSPNNETFQEGIERLDELKLLRWTEEEAWRDVSENLPVYTQVPNTDWIYSNVFIGNTGDFSVGFAGLSYLYLMANAILEGPYRPSAGIMDTTLFANSGPATPPNIYPYNLDPNRDRIVLNPEITGIVDWVVLEFRTEQTELFQPSDDSVFYRTALLRYDGELIDPTEGTVGVTLPKEFTQNRSGTASLDTTGTEDYYIAIRHRNHLAVVTENSFFLTRDNVELNKLNFSERTFILGGALPKDPEVWDEEILTATALKIIAFEDNDRVFGIAAGSSGEFKTSEKRWLIDDADFEYVWQNINAEGYFYDGQVMNADYNMDGIVNSLDFNYSWNNRKRASEVDRP